MFSKLQELVTNPFVYLHNRICSIQRRKKNNHFFFYIPRPFYSDNQQRVLMNCRLFKTNLVVYNVIFLSVTKDSKEQIDVMLKSNACMKDCLVPKAEISLSRPVVRVLAVTPSNFKTPYLLKFYKIDKTIRIYWCIYNIGSSL